MVLVGNLVIFLFTLMQIALFLRFIFAFVDPTGRSGISVILRNVTEPIIGPIRRFMPSAGVIDLSPMVAFLVIFILVRIFQVVWFTS
jgi:YggT family protein